MTTHPLNSSTETMELSLKELSSWKLPPFQRPLRINPKVRAFAAALQRNGGVIDGVITLGLIKGERGVLYKVDGQHRIEGAKIADLPLVYADIRICEFNDMAAMAEEYVRLNSSIVRMRPDDILRGMEPSLPLLQYIRKECPFVGYDQIRRGDEAGAILGMSTLLRSWNVSAFETPGAGGGASGSRGSASAQDLASTLTKEQADALVLFLIMAFESWGRDTEYLRVWCTLNMVICMWLFRRLYLDKDRKGAKRYVLTTAEEFRACLRATVASTAYLQFLEGKTMTELNRRPAYRRLRDIFVKAIHEKRKGSREIIRLPKPAWAT